jgi:hypothetical protein
MDLDLNLGRIEEAARTVDPRNSVPLWAATSS